MKLHGKVLDEYDQPVAGAVVTMSWRELGDHMPMVSDELGAFFFEPPEEGAYRLEAAASGGRYGEWESPGTMAAEIVIRLRTRRRK